MFRFYGDSGRAKPSQMPILYVGPVSNVQGRVP